MLSTVAAIAKQAESSGTFGLVGILVPAIVLRDGSLRRFTEEDSTALFALEDQEQAMEIIHIMEAIKPEP
jgi:hypothetical protein